MYVCKTVGRLWPIENHDLPRDMVTIGIYLHTSVLDTQTVTLHLWKMQSAVELETRVSAQLCTNSLQV